MRAIAPHTPSCRGVFLRSRMLGWLALFAALWAPHVLHAFFGVDPAVPGLLNYQGRVTVSGTPFTGTGQFKFALVNKTGTVTYWSNNNTSTAGSEPTASEPVPVANGIYSVQIGNSQPQHLSPNMTPLPASVFENNDVHLRIWFSDGVNGFQRITPDQRIGAVGYSLMAAGVTDSSITSAKLANGAVTGAKLADGAVVAGKIGEGAVSSSQLAAGAVQGANIAAGAVGNGHLGDHAVSAAKLRLGVETGTIADGVLAGATSNTLAFTATFSYPFTQPPVVTMTNEEWAIGAVTSAGFTATAPRFRIPLDLTGDVGEYTSMAVIDGNPAIAYYDDTSDDLKYIRATNAKGLGWNDPVTVVSFGPVGRFNSMTTVAGHPAIAYSRSGDLYYVRASDATGSAWGTPRDTGGEYAQHVNMAIVDGRPAISYFDASAGVRYMSASDANGTAVWNRPVDIPMIGTASYNSLALVEGLPAVAYYNLLDSNLYFTRATNTDGSAWGDAVLVDSAADVGQFVSMTIVDGFPAMAYHDATNGDLKYVRATEATGTAASWGDPVVLDSIGNVGQYASLRIIAGKPAVAYYDVTNGDLKYVAAADTTGTTWNAPVTLDSNSNVGVTASLAEVNGGPAIAYHDVTDGDLKFTPVFGLHWRASDGTLSPLVASHVADGAVGGAQINSGAVTSDKIAEGAVTTSQIAAGAVTNQQIAAGAVTSSRLAAGAVETSNISAGAITSAQLAAGAVQNANIASGAIQSANIVSGAITSEQLAVGAVQSSNIANGTITSAQLAVGAVQSSHIANGAISSAQLAKPARSGSISLSNTHFDFGIATYSQSFPSSFNNTPIVTQSVKNSAEDAPAASQWVISSTTTSFTGRIDIGRPAPTAMVDDVDLVDGDPSESPKRMSMAEVGGHPALVYAFASSSNHFLYHRADNAEGTLWNDPIQRVTIAGSTADYTITALKLGVLPDGRPTVVLGKRNGLEGSSVWVMEGLSEGSSWFAPRWGFISSGNLSIIKAVDFAIVAGVPCIAAYQEGSNQHKVTVSKTESNPFFAASDSPIVTEFASFPGSTNPDTTTPRMLSMAVLSDGMPAVIYRDNSGNLQFRRATGISGGEFTLAPASNLGGCERFGQLTIINGRPAVVFVASVSHALLYRRANDATGTSWAPAQTLDDGADNISDVSFVLGDAPQVAFSKQGRLRYVKANDQNGAAWRPAVTVDESVNQLANTVGSPVIVPTFGGDPRIGYFKKSGGTDINFIQEHGSQAATINWIALEP